MNKLKFNKTKLVIGFDGKPVSVEPTVGRFTSENRSLEREFTACSGEVRVAMVGKYVDLQDAYKSLNEALNHAGLQTLTNVQIEYIDAEDIERHGTAALVGMDAILVPGGFGDRGVEGKITAVRYARENNIPFLGICLGMHVALVEYARNVCGLAGADSRICCASSTDSVKGFST